MQIESVNQSFVFLYIVLVSRSTRRRKIQASGEVGETVTWRVGRQVSRQCVGTIQEDESV